MAKEDSKRRTPVDRRNSPLFTTAAPPADKLRSERPGPMEAEEPTDDGRLAKPKPKSEMWEKLYGQSQRNRSTKTAVRTVRQLYAYFSSTVTADRIRKQNKKHQI